jgi:hypothetical protein
MCVPQMAPRARTSYRPTLLDKLKDWITSHPIRAIALFTSLLTLRNYSGTPVGPHRMGICGVVHADGS